MLLLRDPMIRGLSLDLVDEKTDAAAETSIGSPAKVLWVWLVPVF